MDRRRRCDKRRRNNQPDKRRKRGAMRGGDAMARRRRTRGGGMMRGDTTTSQSGQQEERNKGVQQEAKAKQESEAPADGRLMELSRTGTYKEYPYHEFQEYRARVLVLVLQFIGIRHIPVTYQ